MQTFRLLVIRDYGHAFKQCQCAAERTFSLKSTAANAPVKICIFSSISARKKVTKVVPNTPNSAADTLRFTVDRSRCVAGQRFAPFLTANFPADQWKTALNGHF
jgi:hypothetical protein